MNRSTINVLLGILIGVSAVIVVERLVRAVREDDPEALAAKLVEHLEALESRTGSLTASQAAIHV